MPDPAQTARQKHLQPLTEHGARLHACRSQLDASRKQLLERATAQRDSMISVITETEAAVEAHPENPLLGMRLQELLRERAQLDNLLTRYAQHDA